MSVTLIAYPLNDSDVEVPYVVDTMGGTDIAITFSIDDINDITKRKGSFSKTIELPNTTTNASLFKFAYNVQSFVGGFQPNKKIRAAMWEDGVQVFSGAMQLLSMSKTKGEVTYEVGMFSEDVSLFQTIQNNLLVNTAGVTGMNHTVTTAHVSATWTASGASGYVYGLVDSYGATDVLTQGWFAVPYWKMGPSIYVKKMVDLIFAQAGYRYSSAFFNSNLFKKLVIPYVAGTIPVTLSGSNIFAQSTGTVSGSFNQAIVVKFSKDTPAPYFDNGGYWVASSSTFVAPGVPTRWNISVDFTATYTKTLNQAIIRVINLTNSTVISQKLFQQTSGQKVSVVFENIEIPADNTANIEFAVGTVASTGTILSGATVLWECLENPTSLGVVDMRTALPADVKQSDLLVDLQKMFNLYFMPDAQDPKLLYIEPFKDFYSNTVNDWSQKADENQEQLLTNGDPNQYKELIFKYKDMGDYLSKTYKSSFPLAKEGYGGRQFLTQNFYGKSDFVCETMAGTLIPASFTTTKIIGRSWDLEGSTSSGTVKQLNTGYRLAQYNSIAQGLPSTSWFYQTGVSGSFATGEYVANVPFISHIDNPFAPTEDLAFGIPRQVFYNATNASGNPITYTNNNLYNKYWLNYITETTSKEALQLELTMMLSAADIYQLDFRKPIYYGGVRWRLLQIRDYLIGQQKPCRVTLRRILNLAEFVPVTSVPITTDPAGLPNGPLDPDPADPTYEAPSTPEVPTPG
ncbi:MAG: hypothetical protein EB117_12580 [Betaproteobacteria bacterium]|nr:hypothetical protein [Betaproteobacteria bacterium]